MQTAAAPPALFCHTCGASTPQKCCSRCKHAHYCNETCQHADWQYHRLYCYAPAETVFAPLPRRNNVPSFFMLTKRGMQRESGEFGVAVCTDISATAQSVVTYPLALEYTLMLMYERVKVTRIVLLRRPQADNPVTAVKIKPFLLCEHGTASPVRCEIEKLRARGYIPFLIGITTDEGTPAEYVTTVVCAVMPRPIPTAVAQLVPRCEHALKACMLVFHNRTAGSNSRVSAMCQEIAKGALGNATKCTDPTLCAGYCDYTRKEPQ